MSERKVLAAILRSRKAYEKIAPSVKEGVFTEQAAVVWRAVEDFYTRDREAQSTDLEIIVGIIGRSLTSPKHRETFDALVKDLGAAECSPANVADDFIAVRREAAGAKLASALITNRNDDEVQGLLEDYELCRRKDWADEGSTRQVYKGLPIAEISKTYSESELIKVWPQALNQRLDGGLLRGHHLIVFARPEMGKTLFLVNAVAGFLAQGLGVLYVGNEDPISDIALRVICRLTKRNKFDVLENPEESDSVARDLGYDNLVLASLAPGTPREIEQLVTEFKPSVVLIDQLRNISVPNKEGNYVQQLEKAATAARNIGKRNGVLVLSVTQAGDSASGKAVLEMGDVDSSNTGIPAQADVMVGIGATQEDAQMGRRVLSLPKNKRSGNHEFFPVKVDTTMSRMWTE
jgi:hypothetical protein